MAHDVVAFGEALLRLQPAEHGQTETAELFHAYPGGAELNTAHALACLGLDVAWFSVLPEGPLGRRVIRHLRGAGVDVSHVKTAPGRLGTYWVDFGLEPRTIEVAYDRRDSTVCHVTAEDVPWDVIRAARCFFVSGITPALSPLAREAALATAAAAREAGVLVATDLNYRARLWSPAEAAPVLEQLARSCRLVIVTEEDARLLWRFEGSRDDVARRAREHFGCQALVLTCGAEGALTLDGEAVRRCAVYGGSAVDRIGAGDAFTAGVLYATLSDQVERALEYGLAMAAIKRSLRGDTLTTTRAEVERVLARESHDIRR